MQEFDVRSQLTEELQEIVVWFNIPPCRFNEYDNNTNGDNSNSNYNDNNNDNNNGNTDNEYKNINNGGVFGGRITIKIRFASFETIYYFERAILKIRVL